MNRSFDRRIREAEATRALILDAARRLFVEHGFEGTSMRAIARAIDYTPTAIYHHFEGKDHLFHELCAADFRVLGSAFRDVGRVDDPVERIAHIGRAYVAFAAGHPMHYQLMFMTPGPTPPSGEGECAGEGADEGAGVACAPVNLPSDQVVLDAYDFLRETVAEAMEAGRFRPELDDPDRAAQLLWSTLHGLISLRIAKSDTPGMVFPDLEGAAREARLVLLRGMLADPATLPDPLP